MVRLIERIPAAEAAALPVGQEDSPPSGVRAIGFNDGVRVETIRANPRNARKRFDEEALAELATSIHQDGVQAPLGVRRLLPAEDGYDYELIFGERRLRAAGLAGLARVPVRIFEGDERACMRAGLVENLQRQDLDPVDEAEGYRALQQQVGMTQEQIGQAVGLAQSTIANAMRLLELPEAVLDLIRERKLTRAHGVAILRYRGFPALMTALGEAAVAGELKVADLADTMVFSREEVRRAKVVREIDMYSADPPYKEICPACPFGAHVPSRWGGIWYCLFPEHYTELRLAARAAEQARLLAQVEAQAAASAMVGAEGAAPPVPSVPEYASIPNKVEITTGSRAVSWDAQGAPEGCTEQCACRQVAASGQRLVPVCTNPQRFRRLQDAERERADRVVADRRAARVQAVVAGLQAMPEPLGDAARRRLLAVVAWAARHGPALADLAGVAADDDGGIMARLVEVDLDTVLAVAAGAVLTAEAREDYRWEEGRRHGAPACEWFFDGDAAIAAAGVLPALPAASEPAVIAQGIVVGEVAR